MKSVLEFDMDDPKDQRNHARVMMSATMLVALKELNKLANTTIETTPNGEYPKGSPECARLGMALKITKIIKGQGLNLDQL